MLSKVGTVEYMPQLNLLKFDRVTAMFVSYFVQKEC